MREVNCLIVDDEELARRLVRSYCDRLPDLTVRGEAANPISALALLREQPVDLVFLDIQMPQMTGLDFVRSLPHPPAVVLTTAYPDHALEGFELDVVDYLLKPFSFERFVRAVGKAREYRFTEQPGTRGPAHLLVRADRKTYRLPYADILYIESLREYVAYHTPEGRKVALGSLKHLEETLPPGFLRVHKSYIVATNRVEALDGNQLQIGSALIPIGGSYRDEVKERLFGSEP